MGHDALVQGFPALLGGEVFAIGLRALAAKASPSNLNATLTEDLIQLLGDHQYDLVVCTFYFDVGVTDCSRYCGSSCTISDALQSLRRGCTAVVTQARKQKKERVFGGPWMMDGFMG